MRLPIVLAVLFGSVSVAWAGVLYDGSLGTPPQAQQLTYLTYPLGGASAEETLLPGGIQLDTTPDMGDSAGYFNFSQSLDRNVGYTLSFEVCLHHESHVSPARAGFSVLVVSSDLQAVELGFWADTVFSQNVDFTAHAASIAHDATYRQSYDLTVLGSTWTLASNGTSVLDGSLVQYAPVHPVYSAPNALFLGDDTTSAEATISLYHVALIPEPGMLALVVFGAAGLVSLRQRCCR